MFLHQQHARIGMAYLREAVLGVLSETDKALLPSEIGKILGVPPIDGQYLTVHGTLHELLKEGLVYKDEHPRFPRWSLL